MFRMIKYSLVFMAILIMACKSDFERVRNSAVAAQMAVTAKELYANGDYNKAIILYELIIPAYRGKSEAETLNYEFADAHFKNSNFILSSHYFKTFADTYTSSPKREEALFLSALSEYKQSPRYKLDQSNSSKIPSPSSTPHRSYTSPPSAPIILTAISSIFHSSLIFPPHFAVSTKHSDK